MTNLRVELEAISGQLQLSKVELGHLGAWKLRKAGLVIALALTYLTISISKIPYIHTDAQYYLQSALLWPDGHTTFAASWIGGRDFVVWIYFLAFRVFGPGIDSIVLALAVIRLATVAALTVFCLCLIPEKIWAVAASLALAAGVLGLPFMNIPATDNVGLMLGAVVLALWALAARASFSWPFVLSFSFFAGVAYTVRAESLLLLLVILALYLAKGAVRPRSAWLYGSVALLAGIALPSAMWVTWVPTPKPAVRERDWGLSPNCRFWLRQQWARIRANGKNAGNRLCAINSLLERGQHQLSRSGAKRE